MKIKIRAATYRDLAEISDMWWKMVNEINTERYVACFDERSKERYYVSLVSRLYDQNWGILVAENADGEVMGYISAVIRPLQYSTKTIAFCDCWYVKPEFRETTASWRLAEQIQEFARARGVEFGVFQCPDNDLHANRWLKRDGYSRFYREIMWEN